MDLYVFHRSLDLDSASLEGGAKGIVVDFETRGKSLRQQGFDTQINDHSLADLESLKTSISAYVICRVNGISANSATEVKQTLQAGADEILIPMVRSLEEVEKVLGFVNGEARVSVMIETEEAIRLTEQLDELPIQRVYIGLNDLRICRGSSSIFDAMADGTVEKVRHKVRTSEFGFGGLTIPKHGFPLPVESFADEMVRLNCQFTFLRRSFFRDTMGFDAREAINDIKGMITASVERSKLTILNDKKNLNAFLKSPALQDKAKQC